MTNHDALAREAISLTLMRETGDIDYDTYIEQMGEICKHPSTILHLAGYCATALATTSHLASKITIVAENEDTAERAKATLLESNSQDAFKRALNVWRINSPRLAAQLCEHGYSFADCDQCGCEHGVEWATCKECHSEN